MQRVVGDEPLPDEIPDRIDGLSRKPSAGALMDRAEERGAVGFQVREDVRFTAFDLCVREDGRSQPAQVIRQVERHAAVAFAERLDARPDDFARGHQGVEHVRPVVLHARRQNLMLEHGRGQGRALELFDGVEERLDPVAAGSDALPRDGEAAERFGIHRLDLLPQPGERAAAQRAKHVGVRPLTAGPAAPEFAFDDPPLVRQPGEQRFRNSAAQSEPGRELSCGKGRVRARITKREIARRIPDRLEQRLRQRVWQRRAERVAIADGVFDGDVPWLAGDRQRHDATGIFQLAHDRRGVG